MFDVAELHKKFITNKNFKLKMPMNEKDHEQFEAGWAMMDKNNDGFLTKDEV